MITRNKNSSLPNDVSIAKKPIANNSNVSLPDYLSVASTSGSVHGR